jgi:prepilin-type N-terminal cleavage/methylation domain-containing protein
MRKFLKYFHQGEKGFTLIELLVVIAILGALAGIVLLNISSFIGKGKCEGFCTEQHNVVTACVAAMVTTTYADWEDYLVGGVGSTKYGVWSVDANCNASTTWTGDLGTCPCATGFSAP